MARTDKSGYMKDNTGHRLDSFQVSPQRAPKGIAFGDSRTANCWFATADSGLVPQFSTNVSWLDAGQAMRAGGPVIEWVNGGIGGNTTAQMLARFDADVLGHDYSYMTLWAGTNDPWTSFAEVDNSYARMVEMMGRARADGIYVFLISETTSSTKGNPYPKYVAYYNDKLRQYAASMPGVEFWDFNAVLTDPASSIGFPKSELLRDGLHLSPQGAWALGRDVVAPRLARIGHELCQLVSSQIDTKSITPESSNIIDNPLMLGTTGTASTGTTGTVPTNWTTARASAVISAIQSAPARADGFGNDLKSEITATAAGSHLATLNVSPTRVAAGGIYVVEAALAIDSCANLGSIALVLQMFQSTVEFRGGFGWNVQSLVDGQSVVPATLTLRSRRFTAPTGTLSGVTLLMRSSFSGAGAAVTRLGRVAVRRVG